MSSCIDEFEIYVLPVYDVAMTTSLPSRPIERGVGVALWRQIAESLRADVLAGRFAEAARLPPETDLAQRFGVNRHTVRRAIAALTAEGLLRADQGRGTFVAGGQISYPIGPRTRFSEIIASQAREPSGRLIGSEVEEADALIAGWLALAVGTPLIRLETVRVVDAVPVVVGTSWFERDRFPGLVGDFQETGSLTEAFRRAGIADYRRRETRITAELVGTEDGAVLELAAGLPVLVVESVNVDTHERPFQYTRARVAADKVQFVVNS